MKEVTNSEWILLTPPFGDITMPMLGIHLLASYLRRNNVKVRVFDTSIQLLNDSISFNFIIEGCKQKKITPEAQALLIRIAKLGRELDSKLLKLSIAAKILTAISGDIVFSLDEPRFSFLMESKVDLIKSVSLLEWLSFEFKSQPFWEYLEKSNSENIGLSVSYSFQLPFALLIAKLIKTNFPNASIYLGGAYFSCYEISPNDILDAFPEIDHIIIGNGEDILLKKSSLLCSSEKIIKISEIKNIEYIPDFSDVKWNYYCTAENQRVIPFSLRSSCYYKKCAFCNGDKSNFDSKNLSECLLKQIISELKMLCKKHSITGVYFTDAALSPRLLKALANHINGAFSWGINTRIDSGYSKKYFLNLKKSGCKMLRVGFETYSQKVLDLMNKGTRIENYEPYFKLARAAGIKIHIYIMYGYPGEDAHDRKITLDFLRKMKNTIYSYSISIFHAIPDTAIYTKLQKLLCPQNTENNDIDINKLYYTEESYKEICNHIEKTVKILTNSYSNRYCYSGRVFLNYPEPRELPKHFSMKIKSPTSLSILRQLFSSGSSADLSFAGIYDFCVDFRTDTCIVTPRRKIKSHLIKIQWGIQSNDAQQIVIQNNFPTSTKE